MTIMTFFLPPAFSELAQKKKNKLKIVGKPLNSNK